MKKTFIISVVLVLLTLPTLLPYFNIKFFYTQDYIFIARLQQMSTVLFSGQFPVRWAPDLRYGEPIFNFYAPLPYYIGALVHFLGFDFIWTAKILFMLSAVLSAAAMYILVNHLFGKKAGLLAAVLYTYAPYKAVDMYVRGSLSETWAFIFFPLIFYTSLILVQKINFKHIAFLALSLAGLFLTHNVTTLMFLPFLLSWWVYLMLREKKWKIFIFFIISSVLGLGLAAFFLLPAIFENNLIQTKYLTVGYFNFRAHFVAFWQFFSLLWGYGSSVWGLEDGLSFQVGLVNIAVLAAGFVLAVLKRKNRQLLGLLGLLGASFILSVFLQHNKSAFVWEAVPEMAFIQFPWRFLGISVFIVSIIGGIVSVYLKNKLSIFYYILIIAAMISTLSYFRPKEYAEDNFFDKFLQVETMRQGVDLTKDYLPIWVQTTDGDRFDTLRAESGEITVLKKEQRSTRLNFSVEVATKSSVEAPVTYFPGWEVRANQVVIAQSPPSKMGLIRFELPQGSYKVNIELMDTPARTLGNGISLISLLIILAFLKFRKRHINV